MIDGAIVPPLEEPRIAKINFVYIQPLPWLILASATCYASILVTLLHKIFLLAVWSPRTDCINTVAYKSLCTI